jgi:hypothetical protein
MTNNIIDAINARQDSYNWSPRDLVMELGTSGLAQELSGTSDKKSREYKSAMRNVNRYIAPEGKQRRAPSKATQTRLNELAKEKGMKPPAPTGGVGINLDGSIAVNGRGKAYTRDREIDLEIAEEDWSLLEDYAREGDEGAAWDLLAASYGVDSMELISGNISIN